jgi:hypothetical protein
MSHEPRPTLSAIISSEIDATQSSSVIIGTTSCAKFIPMFVVAEVIKAENVEKTPTLSITFGSANHENLLDNMSLENAVFSQMTIQNPVKIGAKTIGENIDIQANILTLSKAKVYSIKISIVGFYC